MNMGLDDFIKSERRRKIIGGGRRGRSQRGGASGGGGGNRNNKKANWSGLRSQLGGGGGGGGGIGNRLSVVDARHKIIQKTRAKMKDARERLIELARQTDARQKIMRKQTFDDMLNRNGKLRSMGYDTRVLPRRTINNNTPQPITVHAYRRDQMLYRTVNNRGNMADDEMLMDTSEDWSPNNLPRLQVHLHNVGPSVDRSSIHPSILRTSSQDDSWLRPGPNKQSLYRRGEDVKSRLEPARSTNSQEGFRIVVSNLQPTVTHEDIKELFEDIGTLIGSRVVRPGTAEVIYKTMEDAVSAVDTYHNRQLDGQPMKCMLVKPSNISAKGLASTKGSIVPDLHAIHKALFNK